MRKKQATNLFSISLTILLLIGFLFIKPNESQAGTEHNVRGKAYPGSSLSFDGSNLVDYSNMVTIESTSFWFKTSSSLEQILLAGFFNDYNNAGITLRSNELHVSGSQGVKTLRNNFNDNQWHFVSIVRTGASFLIYVNGEIEATTTSNVSARTTHRRVVGARHYGGAYSLFFNGLIDDVRIYDRALSADEVSRLYQGIDVSSGIVGHWRFDEGTGSVAYDSSGNGNDGTLINSPSWSTDVPDLSNKRYIYFNCIDEDTGRFPFTFPFYFSVDPCTLFEIGLVGTGGYGVDINDDYIFRGYARVSSDGGGLISFEDGIPAGESYDTLHNNCPTVDTGNCNAGNNCSACYNEESKRVYGWAKDIDDNSYIQLHEEGGGVSINNYSDPNSGDFYGYASSEKWGQINFNCLDEGPICDPNNDYKVYRWDLKLKEMSAPNWSYAQACTSQGSLVVNFQWQLISGNQTHYEIKMSTSGDFGTATSTGKLSGTSLICPSPNCPPNIEAMLAYKTSYYWWLKLYDDDNDIETQWHQFDHLTGNLGFLTHNIPYNTINNPVDPHLTFTTYRHKFPSPLFSWLPEDIIAGTSTDFWSEGSTYFNEEDPTDPIPCNTDDCASFEWSSNSEAYIEAPNNATTSIIFKSISGGQSISLKMTDLISGYYCSRTEPMTINYNLPLWREVKP